MSPKGFKTFVLISVDTPGMHVVVQRCTHRQNTQDTKQKEIIKKKKNLGSLVWGGVGIKPKGGGGWGKKERKFELLRNAFWYYMNYSSLIIR